MAGSCTSDKRCKTCGGRHNTLLHKGDSSSKEDDKAKDKASGTSLFTAANNKPHSKSQVKLDNGFIGTAIARMTVGNRSLPVRVALDPGSTHTLISENITMQLKAHRLPVELLMTTTVAEARIKHAAKFELSSILSPDKSVEFTAAISPSLPPTNKPAKPEEVAKNPLLAGLHLADSDFGGDIDVLVGTYEIPCLLQGQDAMKYDSNSRFIATQTIFGWVVTGPALSQDSTVLKVDVMECQKLDDTLGKLFELEKVPTTAAATMTPDEQAAVQQFDSSVMQDSDGYYSAALPKVKNPPALGTSRNRALSRALANERSMSKNGKSEEFNKELGDYITLGHAEIIPKSELNNRQNYYLPVHGVVKETSTTTAMRPVFDGSAKTTSGYSYNDCLLPGPNLYPNISDLLIKFRTHPIAFTADIAKMFRMIKLKKEDTDFHRFLLRRNLEDSLTECRMLRLTFGIRCSPFVATAVLQHHARLHATQFPQASKCLLENFYVDDFLHGASSIQEAKKIRSSICYLLNKANMTLRKWRSNDKQLLDSIPLELRELKDTPDKSGDQSLKALGVHWDSNKDTLLITVPELPTSQKITKRHISSVIGMLYDMLGLISPFIVTAKMILQQTWILKIPWDSSIPDDLRLKWQEWTAQLDIIKQHHVQRYLSESNSPVVERQLHGFSDASEKAFGAAVYVRWQHQDNSITVTLLIAKARVKPVKRRTIPQLELEAAKLLTQLVVYAADLLGIPHACITTWTDNAAVLGWLKAMPCRLKTFQANRVAFIQECLSDVTWRYVPTSSNPADLPSRGMTANDLVNSHLWWHGPEWLKLPPTEWPPNINAKKDDLPGIKATILMSAATVVPPTWEFYSEFSSYQKIVRILATVIRACTLFKLKKKSEAHRSITQDDLSAARLQLLKMQQEEAFSDIVHLIRRGKRLPQNHSLAQVDIKNDDTSLIKVQGRVRDQTTRKPRELIPLSTKSPLTKLFIREEHSRLNHPSTSVLLSILAQTYYIPAVKKLLKFISRTCPTCRRSNNQAAQQQLGLLPSFRTTPAVSAFTHTGIDFAGPFVMKEGSVRKPIKLKIYICLFICLKTKALHIETCRTLETNEFMSKFQKFCNLRGTPLEVFTDNGMNFVGAANELQEIQQLLDRSKEQIINNANRQNIRWHFIPARTPHFGGIWEAGIKAAKKQLQRVISPHLLRQDELEVLLSDVSAILNSRPICKLETTELEEDFILTPGHFITGRNIKVPPQPLPSQTKITNLRRWQLVRRLTQDFWDAWIGCYLPSLQARTKWLKKQDNIDIDDIVFVKDLTLQHNGRWPLARVIKTYPGTDDLVRTVDIHCNGSIYKRSIDRLIKLHLEPDDADTTVRAAEVGPEVVGSNTT